MKGGRGAKGASEQGKRKKKEEEEGEEIVKAQMENSVHRQQVREEERGEEGEEREVGESLSVSAKRGRQTEFQDATSNMAIPFAMPPWVN